MGEVYRATDTNLHRDVAIKVLPPEVVQDPERLSRFKREAHLLAALNHPSIAAIYGLEEADGKPFLALELVEGEDLKERLARGAIPVDEALEIAKQIAEALEEAHGKGIVHRDLKPANVKLTPDGKVKVLDFGLAKAWAGDASGVNSGSAALSQSPTLAHTGTIAGVILGTAAYMSPEQARGKPVDKRADVWSFGVLVWEMLTGRSLFAGDTVTDVIAAVVTREPDLDALPAQTPRAVRRLLSRCLRKDPRTRLPDMGAARLELQEAIAGTSAEAEAPAALDAGPSGRAPRPHPRTVGLGRRRARGRGPRRRFRLRPPDAGPGPAAPGPIRGRGPGRLDLRRLWLARPLSRRAPDRVPGGAHGRAGCARDALDTPPRVPHPPPARRDGGGRPPLLVSGRPVPGVRRRGRAPQAESRRRHGAASLHPALAGRRRRVGRGRHHPLLVGRRRRSPVHGRRHRWRAQAPARARRQARGDRLRAAPAAAGRATPSLQCPGRGGGCVRRPRRVARPARREAPYRPRADPLRARGRTPPLRAQRDAPRPALRRRPRGADRGAGDDRDLGRSLGGERRRRVVRGVADGHPGLLLRAEPHRPGPARVGRPEGRAGSGRSARRATTGRSPSPPTSGTWPSRCPTPRDATTSG